MVKGITISVNYGPLLAITLPRNIRHLGRCVVVTSPEDELTRSVAGSVPGVELCITDAFTRHGAHFNKGLAMEEGLDRLGRDGQILIWDADILLPDQVNFGPMGKDTLYGARRRILSDPSAWTPDLDWSLCPLYRDGGPIGFFQLFNAGAESLKGRNPWYDVSYSHAGGGDDYFMTLFSPARRRVLALQVLHLGPRDTNWYGTSPEARDIMSAYVIRNGWRAQPHHDPKSVDRVGEIVERVAVPGYEPSGHEMQFVKRNNRKG